MKSFGSLKNNDFKKVYENGKACSNKILVMYILKNESEENRLGISVSKKLGNSVVRHRIKRLIKESYRLNQNVFNSSLDIVVIARIGAKEKSYREIESALLHLAGIQGIIKETV